MTPCGQFMNQIKNFFFPLESVQRNNNSGLYDETLVVIEKSNKELEKKLSQASEPTISVTTPSQPSTSKQPPLLIRPRLVDTIHNNKNR